MTVGATGTYNVTKATYGVNLPNYVSSKFAAAAGPAMIKGTGATHIRWPGGNWANMIIWNNDYNACPYFAKYKQKNADWTFTWSAASTFAKGQGIEVMWQMNAAVGLVCGPDVAATLASSFVSTAVKAGVDVKWMEVGNENYGKWEVPYADNPKVVSPARYAAVCTAVANAVRGVKPDVLVGCVGDLVNPSAPNTPFLNWNAEVLGAAGTDMDFLIIHEYYTKVSNGDVSVANMLDYGCRANVSGGPNCGPLAVAAAVKEDVARHAPNRSTPLPVMITEYNMEQPYQAQTWSLLEGLFVARHLGDCMQAGLMGSSFFALANGNSADYGMFSRDAHQIAYAPVFSFAIFSQVAPVGSTMLPATVDARLGVYVYAYALPEDGFYGIVCVNTNAKATEVSLEGPWGMSGNLAATIYTLTAASSSSQELFTATSFAYNGVNGPAKGGPFPLGQATLPKRSSFNGNMTLAAASVTGFVITPSSAPYPPPTPPTPPGPPPPPPPLGNKCCSGGHGCNNPKCKTSGFCVTSKTTCEAHCKGEWCPGSYQ